MEKVFDGDTVAVVFDDGRTENVRYLLVDTPELHHPMKGVEELGAEAARLNADLVLGRRIRLERDAVDRDRYGRLLAHPWLDAAGGEFLVTAELVRAGLALPLILPPNGRHAEKIDEALADAERNRRGLWGLGGGRPFTASQAWAFLPLLRGRFLRLTVDVGQVRETATRWVVEDEGRHLVLAFHRSQEERFPDPRDWAGKHLEVIGKLEAGYQGVEVFLSHPRQIVKLGP